MFGMSLSEIMLIVLITLVFMGPEKIPEAAKFVGKVMREIRKASNLLRDAVMFEDDGRRVAPSALHSGTGGKAGSVDQESVRDPDPRLDVRMVPMMPPGSARNVSAVELAPVTSAEHHREVYLHVPYDETI